jgi:MoxR-like ATPase
MPSDITGTDIIQDDPETGRRRWCSTRADLREHRIGSKSTDAAQTQSALPRRCRARVMAGKDPYPRRALHVSATQNPIELEGTYPLRKHSRPLTFHIIMDYLPEDQEVTVATTTTPAVHGE